MGKKSSILYAMALLTFALLGCSKVSEPPLLLPEKADKKSVPKLISLVHGEDTTFYSLTYNEVSQPIGIDILRKSNGDERSLTTEIMYSAIGLITEVLTVNGDEGDTYKTTFTYDENQEIIDIQFFINDMKWITEFYYDAENRIYGLQGDLATFPMGWRFDQEGNPLAMSISSNFFQLTFSENETGVFHNVNTQPALVIWYGMTFVFTNYELYYFHQKDLDVFEANTFLYRYENKIRDDDGNLIAFNMVPDDPMALSIYYTVQYENP